jgi:hypothetical protein
MGTRRRQLALAAAVLGAACGALLWVGIAASSAGDPKRRLTPEGSAFAKSYLLRKSDLPPRDWRVRAANFDGPNPSCAVKHYNLGALTLAGEAGDVYELDEAFPLVESDAHVFVTAGQARRAFSKESTIGFARCIGTSLAGAVSGSAAGSGALVRVEPLPLGGLAAAARGFRIDVRLRSSQTGVHLAAALVVMRHARAIGVLSVIAAGSPWSQPVLRSLSATMARRMARR